MIEDGTIPSSGEPNIIYHGASSGLLTRGARPDRSHVARGFSKERARSDDGEKSWHRALLSANGSATILKEFLDGVTWTPAEGGWR